MNMIQKRQDKIGEYTGQLAKKCTFHPVANECNQDVLIILNNILYPPNVWEEKRKNITC